MCPAVRPFDQDGPRRPSWLEVGITGHNFGRRPSKVHSTKVWLQLAQWFLRRRFLCEFPIGSYVKLSSAVGAILIEGPNRRTHFWKRTIQWLFHQHFVLIEQMVSDKKIVMGISHTLNFCLFWPIMQITKKGGWNWKKSSPLKLLSQFQPNFAEMILVWSSSKIVSGISEHQPRWQPQPNLL
jgi:hypothetical protein